MLTERDLRELLDLKPQHPVLSIYLNTEPSQGNADVYKLKLRSMLKDVDFPEDTSIIENYIDQPTQWCRAQFGDFLLCTRKFLSSIPHPDSNPQPLARQ